MLILLISPLSRKFLSLPKIVAKNKTIPKMMSHQIMSAPLKNHQEWRHHQSKEHQEEVQWIKSMLRFKSQPKRLDLQNRKQLPRECILSQKNRFKSSNMSFSLTNSTKKLSTRKESIKWLSKLMSSTTKEKLPINILINVRNENFEFDWIQSNARTGISNSRIWIQFINNPRKF